MTLILVILALLLAVICSSLLSRLLPKVIPQPLVQLAIGALLGLQPELAVRLDPDVFFLLFVPPLLFLDGWRIPNDALLKDRRSILHLALGLVLLTVFGMGWFIHWMIPTLPLPVAFALAAIISPTDPIAIHALAAHLPIPPRLLRVLAGEALLNDASGLVCFRFAVAAMLSGAFSLAGAALDLAWLIAGGIACGVACGMLIVTGTHWLSRHLGDESNSQTVASLLIPFAAWLLAEQLRCSGILAAVAAGVTLSYMEVGKGVSAITRIQRRSLWDTLYFAVNGIIFILLGEQLPSIVDAAGQALYDSGRRSAWWLVLYVFAINAGLIVLRFFWVWLSLGVRFLKSRLENTDAPQLRWRLLSALSLSGARGAITLAGAMTLPYALHDGTPFPGRELVILLSMGVIIGSLLIASIGLPLLFRHELRPPAPGAREQENQARVIAAQAAIKELEILSGRLSRDPKWGAAYSAGAETLVDLYRARIESRSGREAVAVASEAIEKTLRVAALRAERDAILQLLRERQIGSELTVRLVHEIDLLEARYGQ